MTAAQQKMEIDETALENAHQGAHLLIVDDDQPWLNRLGRAMESRGYVVHGAASVSEGIKLGKSVKPAYAVVDMRLDAEYIPRSTRLDTMRSTRTIKLHSTTCKCKPKLSSIRAFYWAQLSTTVSNQRTEMCNTNSAQ